ncbi:hypothetical protein, partial [Pseudomonas bubulae]|uniref:hypothetical protein n=1 Tax=Pseudomonas bubulae TaxID=2316085 RepID=UPI002B1E7DD0
MNLVVCRGGHWGNTVHIFFLPTLTDGVPGIFEYRLRGAFETSSSKPLSLLPHCPPLISTARDLPSVASR